MHTHDMLQGPSPWGLVLQGTAATALAGVYGALKVQGKPAHSLTQQRIVVLGAGSAGMGVSTMMAQGMVKHVSRPYLMPKSCQMIGLMHKANLSGYQQKPCSGQCLTQSMGKGMVKHVSRCQNHVR